jgi:hypothetical protein
MLSLSQCGVHEPCVCVSQLPSVSHPTPASLVLISYFPSFLPHMYYWGTMKYRSTIVHVRDAVVAGSSTCPDL